MLLLFCWRQRSEFTKPSKKAPTDLHATLSDWTAEGILNFRRHARGFMLRTWIEIVSASVAWFAVTNLSSSELSIVQSCCAASASEKFDRASQNSEITLAVDSG
jgi:hypothetical protein